jgi:hypothetical protein
MYEDKKDLMYASFDRDLSTDEQKSLREALGNSADLQKEFNDLKELRKKVSLAGEVSFKPFFSERVMERLSLQFEPVEAVLSVFSSLKYAFFRVSAGAAMACLIIIFFNVNKADNSQSELSITSQSITLSESEDSFENAYEQITWLMLEEVL